MVLRDRSKFGQEKNQKTEIKPEKGRFDKVKIALIIEFYSKADKNSTPLSEVLVFFDMMGWLEFGWCYHPEGM